MSSVPSRADMFTLRIRDYHYRLRLSYGRATTDWSVHAFSARCRGRGISRRSCAPTCDEVMTPEFEERALPQRRRARRRLCHRTRRQGLLRARVGPPSSAASIAGRWDGPGAQRTSCMRADAPVYLSETTRMVASIIRRDRHPGDAGAHPAGAMSGDITIALGFTEPECGSDVAAAATKAVRDGDEWVINGSKMFTTNGHIADYVFLLARTSPDKPKHQGLTMFLVPTRRATASRRKPVWTLSGERTNITFYGDVRVGDEWRIGEVDGGWAGARAFAAGRTRLGLGPTHGRLLHHAEQWAQIIDANGSPPHHRSRCRGAGWPGSPWKSKFRIAAAARCVWMAERGTDPRRRGSDVQAVQHRGSGTRRAGRHRTRRPRRAAQLFRADGTRTRAGSNTYAVLSGHHDLCRHQRGTTHHHRPARTRTTPLASWSAGRRQSCGRRLRPEQSWA